MSRVESYRTKIDVEIRIASIYDPPPSKSAGRRNRHDEFHHHNFSVTGHLSRFPIDASPMKMIAVCGVENRTSDAITKSNIMMLGSGHNDHCLSF